MKVIAFSFYMTSEKQIRCIIFFVLEAGWPGGRASDSGARGRGFDLHSGRHVVSLSKIHLPPKNYW